MPDHASVLCVPAFSRTLHVVCQVGKLTALKEQYEELTGEAMPGQKPSKKLAKKIKAAKNAK